MRSHSNYSHSYEQSIRFAQSANSQRRSAGRKKNVDHVTHCNLKIPEHKQYFKVFRLFITFKYNSDDMSRHRRNVNNLLTHELTKKVWNENVTSQETEIEWVKIAPSVSHRKCLADESRDLVVEVKLVLISELIRLPSDRRRKIKKCVCDDLRCHQVYRVFFLHILY